MALTDKILRAAYGAKHYRDNKEAYLARAKMNAARCRALARELVNAHLKANPCIDCGESDLIVLEFDHRAGLEKSFEISRAMQNQTPLDRIAAEIAKCDVRCANCHRRKTYRQRGWSSRD